MLLQYPHSTLVYLCVCVQVCLLRTVLMDIFPLMSLLLACWRDCASSTTGWWWRRKASSSTTSNLTYRSCFRNRCIHFILNTCIHVFNHYSSFPAFFIIYFCFPPICCYLTFLTNQILKGHDELLTELLDPQNFIDNK